MKNTKRKIIYFLICPFLLVLFFIYFICVAYFYDPLQLFSEKYPNKFNNNIGHGRLSAKRAIDNYNFNAVILGTSMLLANNPKELNDGLFINISMNGSSILERFYVLNYVFSHNKNIKHIIYSLDYIYDTPFHYKKDISLIYKINIDFIDKMKIYFQGYINYKCFFVLSKSDKCIGVDHNFHLARNMGYNDVVNNVGEDYMIDESHFFINHNNNYTSLYKQGNIIKNYLIPLVSQHENTNFHIVIPPNSTLYYRQHLDRILFFKMAIPMLFKYKNVKIYFFGNEAFVDNLNNYLGDRWHYKKHINSRINKAINEGTNIITKDNMDEEFDKFIKKVENYDIKAYEEALRLDIRE